MPRTGNKSSADEESCNAGIHQEHCYEQSQIARLPLLHRGCCDVYQAHPRQKAHDELGQVMPRKDLGQKFGRNGAQDDSRAKY